MSAFVWLDYFAPRVRRARGAWTAFAALAALLACGAAFAQATNSIDALAVAKGTSGNTIVKFTLKAPPANPPAGFAIASPARIALDFLDTGNGLGANAAHDRRPGAAQPQPGPGRQPDARGAQPQPAADLLDRDRGQRGPGHAVRPERAARRQGADGAALRRVASRRRRAHAARHRLPPRQERRGPDHRRPVRQLDRHRHPPAGQVADRRLHRAPTCRATSSAGSTSRTSARR